MRPDQGVASIWTVSFAAGVLLMAGLLLDGGEVLRARSRAWDLASGASRAAAQQLHQPTLAQGGVQIDTNAATQAAHVWLAQRDAAGQVQIEGDTVTVTVDETVGLRLLQPAEITVSETVTAQAQSGGPGP